MILEVDIGNSRCKWRVVDSAAKTVEAGIVNHSHEGFAGIGCGYDITRVRACCVAGDDVKTLLAAWVYKEFGLTVEFVVAVSALAGVTNKYKNPEKLGADRWLAMLAAYDRFKTSVVVVDIGSALTFDVVDSGGAHLGGFIAPGKSLMLDALTRQTSRVLFDEKALFRDGLVFGADTSGSVSCGVLAALTGAVIAGLGCVSEEVKNNGIVVMTGGDAELVLPYVGSVGQVVVVPDLVLDGLRVALP